MTLSLYSIRLLTALIKSISHQKYSTLSKIYERYIFEFEHIVCYLKMSTIFLPSFFSVTLVCSGHSV